MAIFQQARPRLHSTNQSDKIPVRRGGEMADTSALGADARKGVEVRVLFSANIFLQVNALNRA